VDKGEAMNEHEFIDTTAKWGKNFVEVLNPLKENEILRVYHDLSQRSKLEPYNPLENNSDYERGFIDGQQKQIESAVHRAVNAMGKKEWVGLTDDEVDDVGCDFATLGGDIESKNWFAFYLAIEAKLKEKNT